MKKKHTTLMIKVDKVLREDLVEVHAQALIAGVPKHATISIRTDATGTNIVFEWVDYDGLSDKEKSDIYGWKSVDKRYGYPHYLKPGDPSPWSKPDPKPKKPF